MNNGFTDAELELESFNQNTNKRKMISHFEMAQSRVNLQLPPKGEKGRSV
jgi:hypothetical protein